MSKMSSNLGVGVNLWFLFLDLYRCIELESLLENFLMVLNLLPKLLTAKIVFPLMRRFFSETFYSFI